MTSTARPARPRGRQHFQQYRQRATGKGNGTFQPAQNFATGTGPKSVAVGDFNNDGKLDLATANTYDLSVLLGNGDGTFQPASNIDIGSNPTSVAVGDFNADGKLDLGVTSNVIILLGGYLRQLLHFCRPACERAAGQRHRRVSRPSNATSLGYSSGYHTSATVADFNADGKQDFATVNTRLWNGQTCCWATATATSWRPASSGSAIIPCRWPRETSTATATSTW